MALRTLASNVSIFVLVAVLAAPVGMPDVVAAQSASAQVQLGNVSTSYQGSIDVPVYLDNGQPFSGLSQTFSYDRSVLAFTGVLDDVASQSVTFTTATPVGGTIQVTASGTFTTPSPQTTLYYLVFSARTQSQTQTAVTLVRSTLGTNPYPGGVQSVIRLVAGWTNIGPSNINTGAGLHANQSGVASAISFAPSSPNILYLASGQAYPVSGPGNGVPDVTGRGGVFKSTDGGQTWATFNQGLAYTDVTALLVDPLDPNTVVVEVQGASPLVGAIYKTINGGLSWQQTFASGGYGLVDRNGMLYATTLHAILVSNDFGTTWQTVASFPTMIVTASSISPHAETMYVGLWPESSSYLTGVHSAYAEVAKSTDGGRTFTSSLQVNNISNPSISQIVVDPSNPSIVWMITSSPYVGREQGNPSLWESVDDGANWTLVDAHARGINTLFSGNLRYPVQYLAYDPVNSNIVYAGIDGGLFRSTDGGTTFSEVTGMGFDIRFIRFDPANDQTIFVGTDQGLYTSSDGGSTWTPLNIRSSSLIYDMAKVGSQIFATVQDMSPLYSANDGATWGIVNLGEQGIVSVDPYKPSNVLMWTEPHVPGFFFVSNNGGTSFSRTAQIDAQGQVNEQIHESSGFAFDPVGGRMYLAGGAGIYESTDNGQSWQVLSGSPSDAFTIVTGVSTPNVIYASNWNGLYASQDFGATWSLVNKMPFNSLAVDPQDTNLVVGSQYLPSNQISTFGMTLQGTVYISQDGGKTFTLNPMSSTDPFQVPPQVYFVSASAGPVLVYTSASGIFTSSDLGKTWQNDSYNLPDLAVTSFILSSGGTAYVSTYGSGIWRFPNFLSALSSPTPTVSSFSDVPSSYWAYSAIQLVAAKGIMNGYPNGTFAPNGDITREEFIVALDRAFNVPMASPPIPSDWTASAWATADVQAALAAGLVQIADYPSGVDLTQPISRQEIARLVVRATARAGLAVTTMGAPVFSDVAATSPFYTFIEEAAQAGIVNGEGNGKFDPTATATRAQAATMLWRAVQVAP